MTDVSASGSSMGVLSPEEVRTLKRHKYERGQLRASMTRFGTFLDENPDPDMVAQRLRRIEGSLAAFEIVQREIDIMEDIPVGEGMEVAEFEDKYYALVLRATRLIRPASVAPSLTSRTTTVTAFGEMAAITGTSGLSGDMATKLPALSMPTFSGSYLEWENFRDMFVSLVHSNTRLTNVQRFQYLKSNLRGEALSSLDNYAITDANYVEAWQLLQDRYGNKRVLLNNHWRAFTALAPVTKESAAALQALLGGIARMSHALTTLGRTDTAWGDYLVYYVVDRLDPATRRDWERSLGKCAVPPKFEALRTFIEGRIQALESFPPQPARTPITAKTAPQPRASKVLHAATSSSSSGCANCKGPHYVGYCPKLQSLNPTQRRALVATKKLCFNCLRPGHRREACPSTRGCSVCQERHHSMLHDAASAAPSRPASRAASPQRGSSSTAAPSGERALAQHAAPAAASNAFLATAIVRLRSATGRTAEVRALLDPGSEVSFITESTVQLLRLPKQPSDLNLIGVGGSPLGNSRVSTEVELLSLWESEFHATIRAFVLARVTGLIPSAPVPSRSWPHLKDVTPMADPQYRRPARVDVILGADIYGALLRPDLRQGPLRSPTAQLTRLGWIIFGPVTDRAAERIGHRSAALNACHVTASAEDLDLLQKFWEVEEVPAKLPLSPDDETCEQLYASTHQRNAEGRYVVRLPFNTASLPHWNDSLSIAVSCLMRLEKRCLADLIYKSKYSHFMAEYVGLGHMQQVDHEQQGPPTRAFYMPHHSVLRGTESDGKLRVVFNASQRPRSGRSLNDHLLAGPTLQRDLVTIILSWRRHAVALTADVQKMYRQILVHDDDADVQRIVWRDDPSQPIRHFRMTTVTYGSSCAPYLAVRTLMQLATDEEHRFPLAAEVLRNQTYVDDILSGADTVEAAARLRDQLVGLLRAGGFELRKWSSNRTNILADFPEDWLQQSTSHPFDDERIKALGLEWSPTSDNFSFQVSLQPETATPTKRSILSAIAKLFDPIGWLAPATVIGKILLQDLWLTGADWDSPLPDHTAAAWKAFCLDLPSLRSVSIPRWIGYHSSEGAYELHGFADASSRAYAAVVYLRTQRTCGNTVTLLAAKTKVAPVKQLSIPRLELCGAVLLSRLMSLIVSALQLPDTPIHLWSDSMVVLAWLQAHPTRWTTFVANRVSTIQSALPAARWRHVPSKENPADLASRGVSPAALPDLALWWNGPSWLQRGPNSWPTCDGTTTTDLEVRSTAKIHVVSVTPAWDLMSKYSSLTRLCRITAWCLRFTTNSRNPICRLRGPLSTTEMHSARLICVRSVQAAAFDDDIAVLADGGELPRRSQLHRLRPFLDRDRILRVGGRLQRSRLDFEGKHPAILPKKSPLSALAVADAHTRVLHGGTQLTLSHIMRQYWILGCRSLVRACIHRCTRCCRMRATPVTPIMGNLPASRVTPTRPFLRSGIDYAGPILLRATKGRGHTSTKGYIALFVCLWSKAVHLEVVSDCTTSAFLAAFKRFVSRRGLCRELLSDNGTAFRGADAELKRMFTEASTFRRDVAALMANDGTDWTFIPPSAPHFGGLWEAGVRSTKHHLRRVIGESTLTFEELSTVLAQVEACLNSRPLTALSSDPADLAALTPGHFLIGEPLVSIPEPSTLETPLNRLSRWQLTTNMRDHFWRRWSAEYLHQLQQRTKWSSLGEQLQVGRLVLVKDERLPPTKWLMGRVVATHPGTDGAVRVVTIRTAASTFKRPVVKLCPLPDAESTTTRAV